MSDVTRVSVEIGGTEISFETGKMAKQASGSVVVQQGDTVVLSTATAGNQRDVDFLPLTVDVEERMYAAGKIPGSFFKREGRAGEKGTLVARMIDRPLRPLFPKGWNYETQLVTVPLSIDQKNPYDILGMNGASAALMVSDIPFPEPVGAVRIGKVDGNFVVNPTEDVLHEGQSDLDLVVSGTAEAILMVEAGANEIPEAEILDALDIAHDAIKKLVAAMNELGEKAGKSPKIEVKASSVPQDLVDQVKSEFGSKLDEATQVFDKLERQNATKSLREEVIARFTPDEGADDYAAAASNASVAFDKLEKSVIRERIAVQKKRPDGRDTTEIRPISVEAGLLPRTHGSALFTRGQTQALSVVALGTSRENMRLDTLGLETEKWYFHHYNFPPFSVGEAGFMRGPKRRDIGHGALAERALVPMIPTQEDFPYTIRVVSDILESNGSSSMASVCGSTLSLMDAGVPIKAPVAGIAMGLIKEGDDYVVLTDIAGVEDHLGDMDFKVAGTSEGITALQMDIKITGVTFDILRDALSQAKDARTFILGEMAKVIDAPREQMSDFAPRISSIKIDPDKIGLLIGKGGETIRSLQEEYEAQIDVDDTGQVRVYAATGAQGDALVDRIRGMTKEVEIGDTFQGKVVKTMPFGAFIELAKGTDGLLHISNVSPGNRVDTVEEILEKGQDLEVRVVEVDRERGRIGLRLADDPEVAGKDASELAGVGTGDRGPRGGGGGGDRGPRREGGGGGRGGDRGGRGRGRDRDRGGDRGPAPVRQRPGSRLVPEHQLTETDSGLRVITERMDGVRSAALGFFVLNGSRGETVAEAGLSHFLEHLLFKGTERFGSVEIDRMFDGWGAELNAGTDKESTTVYARMLDTHVPQAFEVIADMVSQPAFRDVDPERQVVIEEIAMYLDDPQDTVFDVLGEAVFGDHPLGRSIIGRAPVIAETPVDVIRAFHAARYVPSRIVIAAAGSVDHDAIVELASAMSFGDVDFAGEPETAPAVPAARVMFQRKDTEQVHVCLGGVGLARDDDRRFAARVLDAIFGGLSSSRLFQAVREERGLAYSVFSFAGSFSDAGQVGLYVGTRPDNLVEAMTVVGEELRRLRAEPGTAEELERAQENVKARILLGLESSSARMNRLGGSTLFGLPLLEPEALMARIDAVTLDDLAALAAELWVPERLSAAGIGPDEDAFRAALEQL